MTIPNNVNFIDSELMQRVIRSGIVSTMALETFVEMHLQSDTYSEDAILQLLIANRLLTPFQAERIAAGKYKGFILHSYIILDRIGSGGMGHVYLAQHASMRRLVALKVLPSSTSRDPVARERFVREARAAATLNHPNIIKVFDLNRDGKLLYLVMEYIPGVSLQKILDKDLELPLAAAVDYARQVACGLQHAYEHGFVHRDIKPSNLLVDSEGIVRILDLGLVRVESDEDSRLTAELGGGSSILGTADYLAPEQALDSSTVDIRADIYSLGATLYHLLAGQTIFPGGKVAQKLMWQQWREPMPIQQIRAEVPDELAAIIHKALAKKPDQRFQTPQDMADALANFGTNLVPPNPRLLPELPLMLAIQAGSGPNNRGGTGRASVSTRTPAKPFTATRLPERLAEPASSRSGMPRVNNDSDTPVELQVTPIMVKRTRESRASLHASTEALAVGEKIPKRVATSTNTRSLILAGLVGAFVSLLAMMLFFWIAT